MNQIEQGRIAMMAHDLRPDWPRQSVMTLLHRVAGWAFRDVAVQLAYLACDPATETPARLLHDGPWRQLTRVADNGTPETVRRDWCGECDQHSRLVEVDNGAMARCPSCHPLSAAATTLPGPLQEVAW